MKLLNFKEEFANRVRCGEKRQTIRRDPGESNWPVRGDPLRFYTGMRTKRCRWLADGICADVYPVTIHGSGIVSINGVALSPLEAIDMAKRDGFQAFQDFVEFFAFHYGLPFGGVLIEWELHERWPYPPKRAKVK